MLYCVEKGHELAPCGNKSNTKIHNFDHSFMFCMEPEKRKFAFVPIFLQLTDLLFFESRSLI